MLKINIENDMVKITKTIEYRYVEWFASGGPLELRVREAWGALGTTLKRSIEHGDGYCMGVAAKDFGQSGFGIHCAMFVDKQGVGTVPMEDAVSVALGERQPDDDENFLTTDIFAVISGNDVITLNASINAARLRTYLYGLFEKAELHENASKFDILRRADINKLRMIEKRGVEEIDLTCSVSEATLDRIKELEEKPNWLSQAKASILSAARAISDKDDTSRALLEAKKGRVKLSIRVPEGDLEKAKHGLKALANEAVGDTEDDEGFVIHLRNGEKIKSNEITVRKRVRIKKHANTVDVNDAWIRMQEYVIELQQNRENEV